MHIHIALLVPERSTDKHFLYLFVPIPPSLYVFFNNLVTEWKESTLAHSALVLHIQSFQCHLRDSVETFNVRFVNTFLTCKSNC